MQGQFPLVYSPLMRKMNSKRMEIPEDRKVRISSALWSEPAHLPRCLQHILQTVRGGTRVRSACDLLAQLEGGIDTL